MDCQSCSAGCDSRKSSWWPFGTAAANRPTLSPDSPKIALVGMPNVGKSVVFNALTGIYVTVSNYPGTTVEVSRGTALIGDRAAAVVDTPGMYSLLPISEEERVARDLLFSEKIAAVVHVLDGKHLGRMLPLTFQLLEAGLSPIVAVNMMDEAWQLGLTIEPAALSAKLGVPVVLMAAARNRGIGELKQALQEVMAAA